METKSVNELITEDLIDSLKRMVRSVIRKNNWFWVDNVDDVVQEAILTFIKAHNKGMYADQGEKKLKAYLMQASIFYIKALQRKSIRSMEYTQSGVELELEIRGVTPRHLYSPSALDELIDQTENPITNGAKILPKVVARLPKRRRHIINKTLEGMKVRDICQETGLTPNTVSGLKFNAIKELRMMFKEMGVDD